MIPILYSETEREFKTNGIGRLVDAISCVVVEERNGQYELEMEYPVSGKLFSELKHSRVIGAIPSEDTGIQGFEIYKISKPINGIVTVNARHVSYRLSYVPTLLDGTVVSSAQSALQMLFDRAMVSHPFSQRRGLLIRMAFTPFGECLQGQRDLSCNHLVGSTNLITGV